MTQPRNNFACNSAELSLLRHHAGSGRVAEGGPATLSPDARIAVIAGLQAKGLVERSGRYTPGAWSTLWSSPSDGSRVSTTTARRGSAGDGT